MTPNFPDNFTIETTGTYVVDWMVHSEASSSATVTLAMTVNGVVDANTTVTAATPGQITGQAVLSVVEGETVTLQLIGVSNSLDTPAPPTVSATISFSRLEQ